MSDVSQTASTRRNAMLWAQGGTALVAIIVVMVNFISFRRYERWDWTTEGLFTVSERTEKVLAGLDKPVEIYLLMSRAQPNYQELEELLERYKVLTDKLTVQVVDPDREPTKFRAVAEKYGVRVMLLENGQAEAELALLARSGERTWSVTHDDLVDMDVDSFEQGPENAKVNVKTEQALTGAIVQVTSGRPTRVCIAAGHGEWSVEAQERSLYAMQTELKRENIEFEQVLPRKGDDFAKGCDAVFVIGPVKAYSEAEAASLKSYLDGGGNLLLALDPEFEGETFRSTGLEPMLDGLGITVHQDLVAELDSSLLLAPTPIEHWVIADFSDHATMRALKLIGAPVVVRQARSVRAADGSGAEVLMRTSGKAYGETSLAQVLAQDDWEPGPADIKGPLAIAVALDTRAEGGDQGKGGRLIVVGDSDWLSGDFLQGANVSNVDLLASWTGWLTERDALVSIAPRKIDAQAVLITGEGLAGIWFRALLIALAAFVMGVGVWWQRRA